jgi:hypothetical protein
MLGSCAISPPGGWGAQKPPPGVSIDRSHPLAANIVCFWALNDFSGLATQVIGSAPGKLVGATWKASEDGVAVDCLSASSQYIDMNACLSPQALPATLALRFRTKTLASAFERLFFSHSGTNLAGIFAQVTNSNTIQVGWGDNTAGNASARFDSTPTVGNNKWYSLVAVMRAAGDISLYVNGACWAGSYTTNRGAYDPGNGNSYLARLYLSGGNYYCNAQFACGGIFSRAWAAEEATLWSANPYCMFEAGSPCVADLPARPLLDGSLASSSLMGAIA